MRPGIQLILPLAAAVTLSSTAAVSTDQDGSGDSSALASLLTRVGARVEQYYGRAQRIMYRETVRFQTLRADLTWDGSHVRELVYELRVVRDAQADGRLPEPNIVRELVSVDGRAPRPGDDSACDLKSVSPEPLAMLLPGRQRDYSFGVAGTKRTREGSTVMLDYKSVSFPAPTITWTKKCVDIDLPGRSRGRVWADAASGDVLRFDEHLTEMFEFPYPPDRVRRGSPASMTLERADSTIVYRAVRFHDPDETVMLPESIVSLQVLRNSGRPRLRIFQRFSDYRRFITDGRVVEDPGR